LVSSCIELVTTLSGRAREPTRFGFLAPLENPRCSLVTTSMW